MHALSRICTQRKGSYKGKELWNTWGMIHGDNIEGGDRDGWFNSQHRGTDGEKEIKIIGNKRT